MAQTSKVMAALYAVMGLIYVPFGLIIDAGATPGQRLGLGIWLLRANRPPPRDFERREGRT